MGTKFKKIIRTIYLYSFSAVGVIVFMVGSIWMLNVVMKTYIFPLEHYSDYYWQCDEKVSPYDYNGNEREITEEDQAEYDECIEVVDSDARKRDLAGGLSNVIVGLPIWLYHWRVIQRKED